MSTCPCCSDVLLRHIRGNEVYWFCRNCWQQMPALEVQKRFFPTISVTHEPAHRLIKQQAKQSPILNVA